MTVFVCKFYHFILNRRAVTRTGSLNNSSINRGTIQICTDDLMRLWIRIRQPAGNLINLHILRICRKRKRNYPLIPFCSCILKIQRTLIHSRRCSRLKTEHLDSMCFQGIREMICCHQTIRSGISNHLSGQTTRSQISSRTEHNCLTMINSTGNSLYPGNFLKLTINLNHLSIFFSTAAVSPSAEFAGTVMISATSACRIVRCSVF